MAGAAGFWDGVLGGTTLPWGRAPSPAVELLAARLAPGATVLVPGCAYGRNALALAQRGCRAVAYDYSPAGIAQADAAFAHPHVEYVVRAALEVPSGRYDGVL